MGGMPVPWRTLVQEQNACDDRFDVRSDAVAVYGVDETLPARVAGWRERGYRISLMTGLAWGHYEAYLLGQWDGREHWDEAQCRADGTPRQHGHNMPYMSPNPSYTAYLAALLRRAIDAGVEAIYLEEPEYWSATGYGVDFRRAFAAYHGVPWSDPASSPQAWTMAAEVKWALYRDLIADLCRAVKAHNPEIRCYVATHSPLNYTAWAIVSPELSIRRIPEVDGVVVQTWSFTARSQTLYNGSARERIPGVAFLEYGSGIELARGLDRAVWFLTDPVEDRPNLGWDQYRSGYEATVVASLLWPEVAAYEVMPWPMRVFTGRYPHRPDGSGGDPIPPAYAREILAIANAARALPRAPLTWECGTQGLGVLIADSMLLRRGGPETDDPQLSSFYGLALPLLLAGMPVRPVALEALTAPAEPPLRALLLSYDGMTPPEPGTHAALVSWVRAGGALLAFGGGDGPYETLPGWWNEGQGGHGPWADLFAQFGLDPVPAPGIHPIGEGLLLVEPAGPIALARAPDGAERVRGRVREALDALDARVEYREQNYLLLRRGPWAIAMVFEESPTGATPLSIEGCFVDLLDGDLPIRTTVEVAPGGCAMLLDLDRLSGGPLHISEGPSEHRVEAAPACVVAASARIERERIERERIEGRMLRFLASGPLGTICTVRMRLPSAPLETLASGATIAATWHEATATAAASAPNAPRGVEWVVRW